MEVNEDLFLGFGRQARNGLQEKIRPLIEVIPAREQEVQTVARLQRREVV